jgi:hypothetical protein
MYFRLCSVSVEIFACFFMVIQAHAEPMAMTELMQNDFEYISFRAGDAWYVL